MWYTFKVFTITLKFNIITQNKLSFRRQSKIETNIQTKQFFDILQSILKSKVFSNGRWEYLPVNGEG